MRKSLSGCLPTRLAPSFRSINLAFKPSVLTDNRAIKSSAPCYIFHWYSGDVEFDNGILRQCRGYSILGETRLRHWIVRESEFLDRFPANKVLLDNHFQDLWRTGV